jgi:hypothetical protein
MYEQFSGVATAPGRLLRFVQSLLQHSRERRLPDQCDLIAEHHTVNPWGFDSASSSGRKSCPWDSLRQGASMFSSKDRFASVVRCLSMTGLALISAAVAARGASLPTPIRLSDGVTSGPHFPIMALSANGHIDVAWSQQNGIFFRHSADGGATFFSTVEVQPVATGRTPVNLQMGTDAASNIDLLWAVLNSDGSLANLFLSRSTDGGFTFSAPKGLVPDFGGTVANDPALLVHPNGAIDISDFATVNGTTSLFLARSIDGGKTFSAPVIAWTLPASEHGPNRAFGITAAAGSKGQLYLFWSRQLGLDQCDLRATRSLDGGHIFSLAANLSNSYGCSLGQIPVVDTNDGVNVSWVTLGFGGDTSIFFSRSADEGATFSAPTNVSAGFFQSNNSQKMVIDSDGEIAIAWKTINSDGGSRPVVFARSENHGRTFSVPKLLSHTYGTQAGLPASDIGVTAPAIALDSKGHVSLAYGEDDASAIFFRRSSDEGLTFSNPVNLSPVAPMGVSQVLVDKNGNAYILSEGVDLPLSNVDVYFDRVPASTSLEGNFHLKSLPMMQTAVQGQTLHFAVTARSTDTHHHAVQLICGDLPFNEPVSPTCTFTPPSITSTHAGTTAEMTLTIPANEPVGTFLFAVQGEGGATIDTDTIEITVQ